MNQTPTPLLNNLRLEQIPVGFVLMDPDGRIESLTNSFAQLFGFAANDLVGQTICDVLIGEDRSQHDSLLEEGAVVRVALASGLVLDWTVHRIMPGAALGGHYVGMLYETSNLESFENQLGRLDRLAVLGGLSADMAHEIAGPLSVIANNADILLEENAIDHSSRQSLIAMRDEAYRLGKLLRDFLGFARETPLESRPQDIVKLIEMPLRLLRHQAHRKNVTLEIEAEPGIPHVSGDAERLQQLFFNLIKNACEATPPGSEVRIQVRPHQSAERAAMLEVAIVDQGEGIDPQDAEHIFEPFYSTKPAGLGTGLGLPISRRIVEAHRGDLTIRSTPEMGTQAVVKLPVATQDETDFAQGKELYA